MESSDWQAWTEVLWECMGRYVSIKKLEARVDKLNSGNRLNMTKDKKDVLNRINSFAFFLQIHYYIHHKAGMSGGKKNCIYGMTGESSGCCCLTPSSKRQWLHSEDWQHQPKHPRYAECRGGNCLRSGRMVKPWSCADSCWHGELRCMSMHSFMVSAQGSQNDFQYFQLW